MLANMRHASLCAVLCVGGMLAEAADSQRPRGPMDKASAYGAGDCRFESAGVIALAPAIV